MVLNEAQKNKNPGGFGILDDVPNREFARNNMAIKSLWKEECGKTVVYRIKPNMEIHCLSGPVGPQIDLNIDKYLPGDMKLTQLDLFKRLPNVNRLDYIESIKGSAKFIK